MISPDQSYTKKPTPQIDLKVIAGEKPISLVIDPAVPDISKNVFIPTWNNRPDAPPAVARLRGTGILTHQNLTAVIANPGAGKSSIVEALGPNYLNPSADCLGFEVDPACHGLIIVDNERTNIDVWNSFYRMCRRAQIPEGGEVRNVKIAGLRSVARLPERIRVIEHLLETNPCGLLLIDGAGDLVTDTNDLLQAIECRIWLREITVKYNISIFVTLHPNPNTNKPRGHQGSEICREAECVLLAKPFEGDAKIITSDFEQGKNRNNPKLTTAYVWSDNHKMFISADYEDLVAGKQSGKDQAGRSQEEALAKSVLPGQVSLRHTDLVNAIMQKTSKSEWTAIRQVRNLEGWGIVKKYEDGCYRLNINKS